MTTFPSSVNHHPKLVTSAPTFHDLVSALPSSFPTFTSVSPTSASQCIVDTGCTGHYIHSLTPHHNRQPSIPGITVLLPNGDTITSTHTATLTLHAALPPSATIAHIFPSLSSGALLSIGLLCDHGCVATFLNDSVTVTLHDQLLFRGYRSPTTSLWTLDLAPPSLSSCSTPSTTSPSFLQANALLPTSNATIANRVAFFHAALFSPALSTWCRAIDAGHFATWPALTSTQVRRFPPPSVPMVKGHLNQQRANLNSTKPKLSPTIKPPIPFAINNAAALHADLSLTDTNTATATSSTATSNDTDDDFLPSLTSPPATRTHQVYADFASTTGQIFSDLTGRFIQASSRGHTDLLVIYDYDSNYIHVEPMTSKSGPAILAAYAKVHALLSSRGLKPALQRLDNEASSALQSFMND